MAILIALISISALAGTALILNKISGFRICLVCAGVAGTWLWMLLGIRSGALQAEDYRIITAVFIGGSVVGIAYQLEKKLPPGASALLWKLMFIPAGFLTAYGLLSSEKVSIFAGSVLIVILFAAFFKKSFSRLEKHNQVADELAQKMKNCC
ncbi:hypothetical protein A2662_00155 [Candidatus Giovannonibacteria bacterium RIFCSPHIGHO2_01_FULL_45_33]|uniref:Uncharacterized protein n=1 Tax=Candidatus Giovannonibacteria bacterium RIFCSPLOWO2_01_FULL_45_34 TaxID=1798351 RepID=A0A1F5X0S6_9BACT|nr:MAG: hypothetical protein A2662_00155 [Candidatus Giovannonibacteria bacterium RIFCSPHIGHO2_01_FULL_45_33]OGF70753.1 MAG: hypothetical protein A3C73_03250 [Candidatus Giovannonibacteria bacterium RIFCSPHIGHO2_02_FULL_44_11]OGF81453.1 MAG: hypothetical protein A2930_04380 [Candidatus Giovannonibacteria bacterium RIFCSPLOWO2_01_FULL_45_34]